MGKTDGGDVKILTLLQARTSSTRLPGKVLKDLLGQPMIVRQVQRVQRARNIGILCLVTSTDTSDDILAEIVEEAGVLVFRGSLDDVLDRFYQAAYPFAPDALVRLTGDCPLIDPQIIDFAIKKFQQEPCDYLSNSNPPTYPDGMDVEVFSFHALEKAWRDATLPSEREHVTSYIYKHPELFKLSGFSNEVDLSSIRLTVDEPIDLVLIKKIYKELLLNNHDFVLSDILRVLQENPGWIGLNQSITRNAGYLKSIFQDTLIGKGVQEK